MDKILTTTQTINISKKLREEGKTIVLAGGCFDILHIGHIEFLEKAKSKGDKIFIFLENDDTIKKSKGENRPINSQEDRARVLSAICFVDYVVILPEHMSHDEYDNLVIAIKPAIIATTKGDPNLIHKKRQADLINAHLLEVTENISNQSTTRLIKLLKDNTI